MPNNHKKKNAKNRGGAQSHHQLALRTKNPDAPEEVYAIAESLMGGPIVTGVDLANRPLRIHIRGKFRGRNKRNSSIGRGTWLLVGVRDWVTTVDGRIDCDVLEVYTANETQRLRNVESHIHWAPFLHFDTSAATPNDPSDLDHVVQFGDSADHDGLLSEFAANTHATPNGAPAVTVDGRTIRLEDI